MTPETPRRLPRYVGRYAGLVYGSCLRVWRTPIERPTRPQETFFQLTKNAGRIRGSLGTWLHQVAVRQAVDRIRSDSARREREKAYAAQTDEAQTWHEVSPCVDEALEQLDERTRELLVRHYLEGRSMAELAEELGVSRPTVSREIESGLARVRARLQRRGVLVTAAGLSALLTENVAQERPEIVLRQLGKMTLLAAQTVGTAGSGAASTVVLTGGLLAAANTKLITAAVALITIATGVVVYKNSFHGPADVVPPPSPTREDHRPVNRSIPTQPQELPPEAEPESVDVASAVEPVSTVESAPVLEVAESHVAPLRIKLRQRRSTWIRAVPKRLCAVSSKQSLREIRSLSWHACLPTAVTTRWCRKPGGRSRRSAGEGRV